MSSLEFFFQDVLDEVQAIARVANAFIQPSSAMVLDELHSSLESVRDEAGTRIVRWGIGERFPLRTIVSHGGYQANDEGEHNVFAEITSAWDIQRIAPAKRSQRAQRFRLVGLASTRVRLWQAAPGGCQGPCLGVFRMEIGDAASPGCHFHTQILGETNFGPFPKSMDVPRLPGLLATPPAILEFTLGELFQEGWAASSGSTCLAGGRRRWCSKLAVVNPQACEAGERLVPRSVARPVDDIAFQRSYEGTNDHYYVVCRVHPRHVGKGYGQCA